jgi:voltage-gated sodium channel
MTVPEKEGLRFVTFAQPFCQRLIDAPVFQRFVLGLIVFAGLLVGLETNAGLYARFGGILQALDRAVLALFVAELLVRIGACGAQPWRFFRDPWNVFDFAIVAVCVLPLQSEYAAVLRLARVLRVLRLITAVPRLQLLVTALLRSLPSMSYVALLLCVLFYVYAVLGVSLFGRTDAEHFGSLGASALTLFQVVTLEGWAEIMRTQLEAGLGRGVTATYFVSFILLGTMITLNLLIGVIVTGMDEARREMEDADRQRHLAVTGLPTPADDLAALRRQVDALQNSLAALERRLK